MNKQENNFELSDDFYSRTINQENLDLAFDATDDGEFETFREKKPDKKHFFSYNAELQSFNITKSIGIR